MGRDDGTTEHLLLPCRGYKPSYAECPMNSGGARVCRRPAARLRAGCDPQALLRLGLRPRPSPRCDRSNPRQRPLLARLTGHATLVFRMGCPIVVVSTVLLCLLPMESQRRTLCLFLACFQAQTSAAPSARLGIKRVWLHRSLDGGSTSPEAVDYRRSAGISVIPGACPMMFCEPGDLGHRCIRWILRLPRKLPR
jgi:hypothetical protein